MGGMKTTPSANPLQQIEDRLVQGDYVGALLVLPLNASLASPPPAPAMAGVFRTAMAHASGGPGDFDTLRPLLEWFAAAGCDPFDLPPDLSPSSYQLALEDASDRRKAATNSPLVLWCWSLPSAPALTEGAIFDQIAHDQFAHWIRSYEAQGLGSLSQLSRAREIGFDWNRVWENGKSNLLMAVEHAVNALDFTKGEDGNQRFDDWIESFRGLRRLAKEVSLDSPDVAALFWVGEAWVLAAGEVENSLPRTPDRSPADFYVNALKAYGAFQKELKSRWPEAFEKRFSSESPWGQWLQDRAGTSHEVMWTRVANWASAVRITAIKRTLPFISFSEMGASEDEGMGWNGEARQALEHSLAVFSTATPLFRSQDWQANSPLRGNSHNNHMLRDVWEVFADVVKRLKPSARQTVFEHPAVWMAVLPGVARIDAPDRDSMLLELVQRARAPEDKADLAMLETHSRSTLLQTLARSARLSQRLPEAAGPRRGGPRF